jgi:IS5 family transposase
LPKLKCHTLPLRPVPILPRKPCANYLDYRRELEGIDHILHHSGLDQFILDEALKQRRQLAENDQAFQRGLDKFIKHTRSAFRIGILRAHKGGASVRNLEVTLADSPLEQWFCFVENFDELLAPSKSTVDRAKNHISAEILDKAFAMLLQKAASAPIQEHPVLASAINLLGFEVPVDLDSVWYDATCHCPDIHFPVDWVQLGDCCRTLLKATRCIREHGIKNRMPKGGPDKLLRHLNQLIISLGNARRRKDSKTLRKKITRQLKDFSRRMARHARTHRDLLVRDRALKTKLSPGQAALIIQRIDHVLDLLPKAIKQTHERIIGERRVPNDQKILSIYEPSTKVLVRGKSGAEVEYGNPLLLGENRDGLIVHWDLFEEVRSDSKLLLGALEATEKTIGAPLEKVVADRGFSNEKMQRDLSRERPDLIDHICPRSPAKMAEKKNDPEFRSSQTRRAQTEARIAIITNNYQRGRSLSKGLDSQRQELRWVMLAHNLRLLSRKLIAEAQAREKRRRKRNEAA